ncbi:MAG: hypothetical protein ABSE18_02055 [Minisyncoccia bacterium]|jgi:hypothetical protein
MKKLFITLFFVVAIASFGGILRPVAAHADDTLTPTQAAVLQQSLTTMKAELLELQAQAAAQTGAPTPVPAVLGSSLTPEDAASLVNVLSVLSTALTGLQSSLASNPQIIAGHEGAIISTLKDVGTTLAMIGATLAGNPSAAPLAVSSPSAVAAAPVPQVQVQASVPAPETSTQVMPQTSGATNPESAAPQTAQVGTTWSLWNLNWPLIGVIALVVVAVLAWLFWPSGENEEEETKEKSMPLPAPAITLTSIAKPVGSPSAPIATSAIATPLGVSTGKPPQPPQQPQPSQQQHQQRKPA